MKITELKIKRNEQGFKQTEIAIKAKKSLRSYQEYEAGERLPDVHTAQRIAKALNTTVDQLFPVVADDEKILITR